MRALELDRHGDVQISRTPGAATFAFPLGMHDRQVDVAFFDRSDEVHLNVALGRLCAIGCQECSATHQRRLVAAGGGNLTPAAIGEKVWRMVASIAPELGRRRLVISAMNDGDPLVRPAEGIVEVVRAILDGCRRAGVALDRLNLSSAIIPMRPTVLRQLARQYAETFGAQLVQWQGSLLAERVKRNIFAGDRSDLRVMAAALGEYRSAMRAAAGRGSVWINYVAVRQGDYGRADGAHRLASVARVADTLVELDAGIELKITRGTLDGLAGWQALDDTEYAMFIDAVRRRWGNRLTIRCPDEGVAADPALRCGRLQVLGRTAHAHEEG